MDENFFWLRLWQSVAVAFVIVVLAMAGCSMPQATAIERLVADGSDPQKASCAIRGTDRDPVCVLLAGSK